MGKLRVLFFLLLISFGVSAQKIQKVNTYGYEYNRFIVDTLFALPGDTFTVPAALQSYPFLAKKGTTLYLWNTSTLVWASVSGGGGGSTPTLQQVLTAGSTLTTNNTIDGGGYDLAIANANLISLRTQEVSGGEVNIGLSSSPILSGLSVGSSGIVLFPLSGNLKIDTLNYTLSTTGKKIMLRDTATGLVQNIDPALLTGATPTLQQVLTAGSTLLGDNTIDIDSYRMDFTNAQRFRILDFNSTERLRIAQSGVGVAAGTQYTTKLSSGLNGGSISRYLLLAPDSTILTGIPYTLSTTGKKIMLRDTATGLVQNIDPALIGGSTAISSLTAATGTNTIDNGQYTQTWNWNSLNENEGLFLSSNSTVATDDINLLRISLSGTHSNSGISSTGIGVSNNHTGTSSTNFGVASNATGGTTNIAGSFSASGGTNNYAIIVPSSGGSVGIGTSTPAKIFHTVGTVRHASLGTASGDTTTNKPLGINSSGDIIPMTYWPGGGGGGSGVTTMASIGASPNANGATISGSTLNLQPASASFGGVVTTGTQTFAGAKKYNNDVTVDGTLFMDASASPYTGDIDIFVNGGASYPSARIRGTYGNTNGGTLHFYTQPDGASTAALVEALKIDQDKKAYFYGDVNIAGAFTSTTAFTLGGGANIINGTSGVDNEAVLKIRRPDISGSRNIQFIPSFGGTGAKILSWDDLYLDANGGNVILNSWLKLPAGTSSAQTAPLKFTSGTNLTTAEAGAVEYDGKDLFFTPTGTIRKVIPTIISSRSTGQTAAVTSVATQTVGASDASFLVSANILITTSSAEAFTTTVAYTDEGNTARTLTLNYSLLAGTIGVTIAAANGAVPYQGVPVQIRCKASTTITIATTGTFTGCTYNVEGTIQKIQ